MKTSPSTSNSMDIMLKDGGVAAVLVLALTLVFAADRLKTPTTDLQSKSDVSVEERRVEETKVEDAPVAQLRLGVTPADFDNMGKLLDLLGDGYRHDEVQLEQLLDPRTFDKYDILFLTCGGVPQSWLLEQTREAESRGRSTFRARPEVLEKIRINLKAFVTRGGTLYASDWRFSMVAGAFEDYADPPKAVPGKDQEMEAEVVDSGLREIIGPHIKLRFDQPGWFPAAFRGKDLVTYLRGQYEADSGGEATAPLLVKFPISEGAVIFTSFHNEKQNSEVEMQLLRYLVFATVTAKTESKITKTMVAGGFSPKSSSLLSTSSENPTVTRNWNCSKPGPVQFVLGFENHGAILRLSVVGPDGKEVKKEGTSSFQIEVPHAAVGEWQYTVTAVKVPHANFPFTLTIGEK